MFQRTIPLSEIRISGTEKLDSTNLPAGEAKERIQVLYAFLGPVVTATIQSGVATIQVDVESELDRRGQRLLDKAIAEANRGRYPAAVRLLEQVLAQAPANALARRNLGMAHLEQGEVGEAERTITEALRLEPEDAWSLLLLGNIYFQHRGDPETAEVLFQQAAAANPDDPYLLSNLGSLYAGRGDNQAAREYFRGAIATDFAFPNATQHTSWPSWRTRKGTLRPSSRCWTRCLASLNR